MTPLDRPIARPVPPGPATSPPDRELLEAAATDGRVAELLDSTLWHHLYEIASVVQDCGAKIDAVLREALTLIEGRWDRAGDALEGRIWDILGGINQIAEAQGCDPIPQEEIQRRAAVMGWPIRPLPGLAPIPEPLPPLNVIRPMPPGLVAQIPVIPPMAGVPPALIGFTPIGRPTTMPVRRPGQPPGQPTSRPIRPRPPERPVGRPITMPPGKPIDGPSPVGRPILRPPPPGTPGAPPQTPQIPIFDEVDESWTDPGQPSPPSTGEPTGLPPPSTPSPPGLPPSRPVRPTPITIPPGGNQPILIQPPLSPAGQCQPIQINLSCPPAGTAGPAPSSPIAPPAYPPPIRPIQVSPTSDEGLEPIGEPFQPGPPIIAAPPPDEVVPGIGEQLPWMPPDEVEPPPDPDKVLAAALLAPVGSLEQCRALDQLTVIIGLGAGQFLTWLMGKPDAVEPVAGGAVHAGKGTLPFGLEKWWNRFVGILVGSLRGQLGVAYAIAGCQEQTVGPLILQRALIGIIERWIGAPLTEARTALDYMIGQLCAQELPSPAEVDLAWLSALIDDETWDCWMTSNGRQADPADVITRAKRTRPNAAQVVALDLRGHYTEAEANQRLREEGVIDGFAVSELYKLAQYLPGPSDLIRFMVRDVADPAVVGKYGYDDEFAEKYKGEIPRWARAQGMNADTFLYFWRAHWHLPSPTQAYVMMHRLRPGRVPKQLETTREEVEKLLQVDDYPPFWRQRLIEVSHHPLTRVDTRRAYFIGSLSEPETIEAILDLGYNQRDAGHLLAFWRRERVNYVRNQRPFKAYVAGAINEDDLRDGLAELGIQGDESDWYLKRARQQIRAETRAACIKGVRRRVMAGQLSTTDSQTELISLGMDLDQSIQLANKFECEQKARGKQLNASILCKWFGQNLIDGANFLAALVRLGYDQIAAQMIVRSCTADLLAKRARETAASRKAAELLTQRTRTKAATEARRRSAELGRAARVVQRQQDQAERVARALVKATKVLVKVTNEEPGKAREDINSAWMLLQAEKGFTPQGAANMLVELAQQLAARKVEEWREELNGYINALPQRPAAAPTSPETRNGQQP